MAFRFHEIEIPNGSYLLKNASLPSVFAPLGDYTFNDDVCRVSIIVSNGKIESISTLELTSDDLPVVDLDASMIWPLFAECHTHIDKGHIWARRANPDGTFMGALEAVRADSEAHWTQDDLQARMSFALQTAYAHGTRYLRTHIDSIGSKAENGFAVFSQMREEWRTKIDLQAVCLVTPDIYLDHAQRENLEHCVTHHGGHFGMVTFMMEGLDEALETAFKCAERHGRALDFHVDETLDPSARSLEMIADTAIRLGFEGSILCGHCCSLSLQDESDVDRVLDKLAQAHIDIVSLPMCNMYLQDRHFGRTPRYRGVTLLHEMKKRGIRTAISSDNTRDPFYAYGDLDPLEVYREATRILHLDHPVSDWPTSITRSAAQIMGFDDGGQIAVNGPADMVIFNARSWTELLSRPQSDRIIIRDGTPSLSLLPDYRELDPYVGAP